MGKFQDLKVWQRSKDLAIYIYKLTGKDPFTKDFNLRDQIRRAAVSIPSNIAEGDDLGQVDVFLGQEQHRVKADRRSDSRRPGGAKALIHQRA